MEAWIIHIMNQFGYIGIAFLIALENIFPPIPSEVILTFGGFMTLSTKLSIIGVIIAATIGSVMGALLLYFLGRFLTPQRLKKLLDGNVGKILHLKISDIEKADQWFDTHGRLTVFFCRFIPLVRSLISIPAGMSEMPFMSFVFLTTIGTLIWNTVLVLLGKAAGDSWQKIVAMIDYYAVAIFFIIIVIIMFSLVVYYHRHLHKKK